MRLIKYLFIFGLVCGVLAAIGVAGVVWHFSQDLPSTEGLRDVRLQVPLRIYSADNQLIGEYGAERREPLAYQEIPDPLIKAFLAAEDDRFFKHPGVDYQGLLRAAWVLALTGEKAQGGSTITMQLARNFFLSSEKSYVRKVREILLALQMERQLSKQEILTFYLNKIFLGHRAYGIGAAAKVAAATAEEVLERSKQQVSDRVQQVIGEANHVVGQATAAASNAEGELLRARDETRRAQSIAEQWKSAAEHTENL